MFRAIKFFLLTCGFLASITGANAKESEVDMKFHGTLIEPPPCTINDGNNVEVDFGERVGINKVDGEHYRQQLNYQITCTQVVSGNWTLMLSLNGNAADFDDEALSTNKAGLGIRVYQGDTPLTPNRRVKISLANQPRLEAVPIKQVGATLSEGAFETWATLRADYE
ncbi:fimbrial protein [Rahnella variigena]|jgi:type 1 fimbria pilin|uniref:fimbrial protein n=1 Tax=Rahnella variigena TaxID=574964 RepID=UPI000DE9EF22|nr:MULTISPECIES: fimbrial protein [Rahnella]RBQ33676.1 pilus assembly protein [Rahnella aquatilis]